MLISDLMEKLINQFPSRMGKPDVVRSWKADYAKALSDYEGDRLQRGWDICMRGWDKLTPPLPADILRCIPEAGLGEKTKSAKARWEFVDREKPALVKRSLAAARARHAELFPADPFPEFDARCEAESLANRYLQAQWMRDVGLKSEIWFASFGWRIPDDILARCIGCAASRERGGVTPSHIAGFLPRKFAGATPGEAA